MKIVFIASKTSSLLNFRGQLMQDIKNKGYEVVAIVPEDEKEEEFQKLGIQKVTLNLNRKSTSIIKNFEYFSKLRKILKEIKPDKVFSYTIKPVIFGSLAAHFASVKEIYSLVCGLGYVYSVNNLKIKILRPICNLGYKIAFKYNNEVIFQNQDDLKEFVNKKIIKKEKAHIVNGSGVDLKIFKKNKLPNNNSFIMVSRIIKEKGVKEYMAAAKIVKKKYPDTKFTYIGAFDESYPKDYQEIKKYIQEKVVDYIPQTDKVYDYLKDHSIFVLPTYYREGIPKTILEAMAMGRPILTTNTPGCKKTVKEGINGYFVKPQDICDLALKMEMMLNKNNLQKMGNESYKMCQEKFTIQIINAEMMRIMKI